MTSPSRTLRSVLPLALLLFAACVWLDTRHNRFPFFYHRDEPDKVAQVINHEWNFHHPTLMLATVKLATHVFHVPSDEQLIVQTGRWISAVFAAIGVTALASLGYQLRGWKGFAGAAVVLALHHQIFELAHYMKEDTALLTGLALTFLALYLFWKNPYLKKAAVFLGAACGLSLSAKYIGAVMLAPALVVIACTSPPRGARMIRLLFFALGFVCAVALANYPLLANLDTFKSSFSREVALVAKGKGDVSRHVPHSEYLKAFVDNTNFVLWLLLAVYLVRFWKTRRERSLPEWMAMIFPFAFALALSFSPKANDRYFLPCTALFGLMAGLGIADTTELLKARIRMPEPAITALLLVVTAAAQTIHFPPLIRNSLVEYYRAFSHDDRAELARWIATNLPANAVIAQDTYVGLPTPDRPERLKVQPLLAQKIVGGRKPLAELAESDNPDSLLAQGVTYVVASESDYGRYRRATLTPQDEKQADFLRKKKFYDNLRERYPCVWSRSRSAVIYLHPGLELYRLSPEKS